MPSSDELLEFEFTVINLPSFVLVRSTQKLESLSVNTKTSSVIPDPNVVQRTLQKLETGWKTSQSLKKDWKMQ